MIEPIFNYTLFSLGLGTGLCFWLFAWGFSKVFSTFSQFFNS